MKIRWILSVSIICVLFIINVADLFAEKTWTQRADMPTAKKFSHSLPIFLDIHKNCGYN